MKRRMKRTIGTVVAMVMGISLMACGTAASSSKDKEPTAAAETSGAQETQQETPSAEKKFKVGYSVNSLDTSQSKQEAQVREFAEAAGIELISTNADGVVDKQISDIESLITQKCDLIAALPLDPDGLAPAFEEIKQAGIPSTSIIFDVNASYTALVGADNKEGGKMQAAFCNQWLEENPDKTLNIGYMAGAPGMTAGQQRHDGFMEDCVDADTTGRVKLLADKTANWMASEATALMEDWLTAFPEINCIVCTNDDMAIGAIAALTAAQKNFDDYLIVGIDALEPGQDALKAGTLDATVFFGTKSIAKTSVDTWVKILNGETVEEFVVAPNAYILVTKDNLDQVLAEN
ncbi:rhizopine-binding protein [Bacteroidia bacterium]|nr:rhizopine-binding protein [Bacteroidia bacterium]